MTLEKQLVLLCTNLARDEATVAKISRCMEQDVSWPSVVQEAKRQGVAPLVYYQLSRLRDKAPVPEAILLELKQHYLDTWGRNLAVFEELKHLLALLKQAGIDAVVLKGPALIETVYKDWGLRWVGDLDILVRQQDIFKAKTCLLAAGYLEPAPAAFTSLADISSHRHLNRLTRPGSRIEIELHWTIRENEYVFNVDIDDIWSRVQTCRINGLETLVFSPGDTVLHLALHHCHDHIANVRFKEVYDIAAAICHYGDRLEWDGLLQRCRRYRIATPVCLGLHLAQKWFAAPLPEKVLTGFRSACDASQLQLLELARKQRPLASRHLFLINNFHDKWKYLLSRVLPAPACLRARYSLPVHSKWVYLYYLIRPFHLIKDHTKYVLQLFFSLEKIRLLRRGVQTNDTLVAAAIHHISIG